MFSSVEAANGSIARTKGAWRLGPIVKKTKNAKQGA